MLQILSDFVPRPLLGLWPGHHSGTSDFHPRPISLNSPSKNFSNPAPVARMVNQHRINDARDTERGESKTEIKVTGMKLMGEAQVVD